MGPQPMRLPDRLRLPLAFDPALLRADVERLAAEPWTDHFVPQHYSGDWSVIPLRAPEGATHPILQIAPRSDGAAYVDTPLLQRTPYLSEALAAFACPLHSVRLMRLGPGSTIKEHTDFDLNYEQGAVRFHVPVVTNDEVEFLLNGRRVILAPGEVWYLRLSDPHAVANRGDCARIHLVIDAVVNDWVKTVLVDAAERCGPDAGAAPARTSTLRTPLDQFRAAVLEDVSLHEKLRRLDDAEAFIALVLDMGRDRGFAFTAEDVQAAMGATWRVFLARSIVA